MYDSGMVHPSDLAGLRTFIVVANALSFSRAADTLGVSSSALSQTIREHHASPGQGWAMVSSMRTSTFA